MRIALLSHPRVPTPPRDYGGVERVVHLLAVELGRLRHDVTVVRAPGSPPDQPYDTRDYAGPMDPTFGGPVPRDWGFLREFDVVHNHSFGTQTWGWRLLGRIRRANPALVTTFHTGFPYWIRPWDVLTRWRRRSPHWIVLNRGESGYARRWFVRNVHLVPVPVADGTFRGSKDDYLLYFGRLSPEKGLPWALEVAERTGMRLVIAGPGTEEEVAALKPRLSDRVEYRGTVDDEEKDRLIGRARCLLFPSRWKEGMPAVIAEAALRGTPVITTRFPAVVDLVKDGDTGFVCKNVDQMVEAVAKLGSIDPLSCREFVLPTVTPRAVAEKHVEVYRRAMRKGQG